MQLANIAFNPPDTVFLDSIFAIELDLSLSVIPDSTLEEIRKLSKPHAKITQKVIKVSKKVKAALSGDFEICSMPQLEQEIIDSSVISWVWNIKAKTPGTKYLNLDIVTIIEMDGKSSTKSIKVFHEPMIVVVKEIPKTWRDYLAQFIGKLDYKWIFGTLVLPLIGLLWNLYQKKRKDGSSSTKAGKD